MIAHLEDSETDVDRDRIRAELLAEARTEAIDDGESEIRFAELMAAPVEAWDTAAAGDPRFRTLGLMRRTIREIEVELDRRPEFALKLVQFAERWTVGDDITVLMILGDLSKHRSNALRHLGRYPEAFEAAVLAEAFYRSVPNAEFDAGQARFTGAVALIKMNRYVDALAALADAEGVLEPFGPTVALAKVLVLRAGVVFQQGDIESAFRLWTNVIPALEALHDDVELARVRANLAECQRMRGAYDEALRSANAAIRAYTALGMETEKIRAEWTVANIFIGRGDRDEGLERLYGAAASFEVLGMVGDAGFVKLDVVEELLLREEWSDAAIISRELLDLFTRAGVTVACLDALSFLRKAVEHEQATISLVRYVREYVASDDPGRAFVPPTS